VAEGQRVDVAAARASSVPAERIWEAGWGYSRAVRVGSRIEVSGTSAMTPEGTVFAAGDAYGQTRYILGVIGEALEQLGGSLADVVRTRVFLVDVEDWREVGRAHAEVFGAIKPASSCVGGVTLLAPELLVEIEAAALLPSGR
jgi:enamine deaminase RidA (YjgF/YER057c/UK114 family)